MWRKCVEFVDRLKCFIDEFLRRRKCRKVKLFTAINGGARIAHEVICTQYLHLHCNG